MKVSVITAFYDGNKYMPKYLKCMQANAKNLEAAGHELEVIIVNDSPWVQVELDEKSPDKTSGNHGEQTTFTIINQDQNTGIHGARVAGLKAATGDYVMFLDQDDSLSSDALVKHVNKILDYENENETLNFNHADQTTNCNNANNNHNLPITVSNANLEQADGSMLLWYRTIYHQKKVSDLDTYLKVGVQIISPGQCLVPRKAIPDIWMEKICSKNGSDDYYLWLVMLGQNQPFEVVDEPLYTHKFTGANLSADTTNTDVSTYEFIDFLRGENILTEKQLDKLLRMSKYKADFRRQGKVGKAILSLKNIDIFIPNLIYKIKTKTPPGFNR
ncbi:MAG: glycosyltransferase family 2 protein [Lachnospiraceae bacterium]|nr:glycosyltransferase family 2 protein [Lachnospiraceae bacterium]